MAEIISLSQVTINDVRQALAWLSSQVSDARADYQRNFNAYRFNATSQSNEQRQRTVSVLQQQAAGLQTLEEWLATAQQRARDYGMNGLGVAPLAAAGIAVIAALLIGLTAAVVINQLNQQKAIAAQGQQQANVRDLISLAQQAAQNVQQDSSLTPQQKAQQQQQILQQAQSATAAATAGGQPQAPSQFPVAAVAIGAFALIAYFAAVSD